MDLKTCTVKDLEKIYGIGRKTSRCFILHSRENAQYAGLDTHLLKHLRTVSIKGVPIQTPSSEKQYRRLEKEILKLAKSAGMSPADYDLKIWKSYVVK
jgi:thermostable 8-oxoguanine DNA glycosylase